MLEESCIKIKYIVHEYHMTGSYIINHLIKIMGGDEREVN